MKIFKKILVFIVTLLIVIFVNKHINATNVYPVAPFGTIITDVVFDKQLGSNNPYAVHMNQIALYNIDSSDIIAAPINPEIDNNISNRHFCKFNCHSYAFYSQSLTENEIWINNPNEYLDDGSYIDTNQAEIDSIVLYWWVTVDVNAQGQYYDRYFVAHSAIISETSQSFDISDETTWDSVKVISKWGLAGIYRHTITNCPYYREYDPYEVENFYGIMIIKPNSSLSLSFSNASTGTNYTNTYNMNGNRLSNSKLIKFNVQHLSSINISLLCSEDVEIKLYDKNMNVINYSNSNSLSLSLDIGLFYLYFGTENKTITTNLSITIIGQKIETYSYIYYNSTHHKYQSCCGTYQLLPHIVDSSSIVNGTGICLLCGGEAEVGFIVMNNNDFCILPNEVIVISDSDINRALNILKELLEVNYEK